MPMTEEGCRRSPVANCRNRPLRKGSCFRKGATAAAGAAGSGQRGSPSVGQTGRAPGEEPGTGRGLGNGQCTSGGGGSVAGGAGRRRCGERRESDAVGGLFVILA